MRVPNLKRTHFILILLLFTSVFLRTQHLPSMWDGDIARDYLVAYHINKYQEYPLVGHAASGINFYYPPYYYYFLSVLMRFSTNYFYLLLLFSLLNALSVLTVYGIGKLWFSTKVGLIAALLLMFSTPMTFMGRSSWSAHIIVPPFLFSFWLFSAFLKDHKQKILIISLSILFLISFIHYSMTPYIFLFLSLAVATKNVSLQNAIRTAILIICIFFLAQIPLIINFGLPKTVAKFSPQQNLLFTSRIIENFTSNIHHLFQLTHNYNSHEIQIITIALFLITAFVLLKHRVLLKPLILFLPITIFLPIFTSFKTGSIYGQFFTSSIPLIYIVYAYFIHLAFRVVKNTSTKVVFFFAVLFLIGYSAKDMYNLRWNTHYYEAFKNIADKINHDIGSFNFQLIVYDGKSFDWHNPAGWYFLEKRLDTKLLSVVNYGNNLKPQYSADSIYLVCKTPFPEDIEDAHCKDTFSIEYPRYRIHSQLNISYPDFSLYKYTKR